MEQLPATTTSEKFLTTYSPKEVSKAFRNVNSVSDALDVYKHHHIATLQGLQRNMGENKILALIKLYLIELNDLLGLKVPMSEAQIDAVAEEVLVKYRYFTMADINLIFRRIKCGEYEKLYDRLTMPQLMRMFAAYDDERCEESARRSIAESDYYKGQGMQRSALADAWHAANKSRFEMSMMSPEQRAKKLKG